MWFTAFKICKSSDDKLNIASLNICIQIFVNNKIRNYESKKFYQFDIIEELHQQIIREIKTDKFTLTLYFYDIIIEFLVIFP